MRYGDDFIILGKNREELAGIRIRAREFLKTHLRLATHLKNDIIVKVRYGIHFLGVELFPSGRRLRKRAWMRARTRLNYGNSGSYHGLIIHHQSEKMRRIFDWHMLEKSEQWYERIFFTFC